jgi:DnaA family protein
MRQLILDLVPAPPPTLDNFVAGSNTEALTGLASWLLPGNGDTCLLLWGEPGAGKTHLLQASGAACVDAESDPALATMSEDTDFSAVDKVEALNDAGQIALFNRFNRLRASGGRLLATASAPPLQLALREDLRTRLGSGLIFRLHPLSDEEKRTALQTQAKQRGMSLGLEAIDYLLARAPRDMRSLAGILVALDRYSLERKRPLTLPLLREVLQAPQPTLES